jgi:PKD repeat protein
MFSIVSSRIRTALVIATPLAITLATGCTLSKDEAPALSGPSASGISINAVASPDTLPRDGQSVSVLRLAVRDFTDKAVPGQRLMLAATAGTLSATDVTTDSSGNVTVQFTAPPSDDPATSARISATPIAELGVETSRTHSVLIALSGPSVPVAAFAWTPSSPKQFDVVTFDASSTTLNGSPCAQCTYSWNFGDATPAGANRITTHRYDSQGIFSVILTVTSPDGIVVTKTQSVSVGMPATITAVITQSPTDPKTGDLVRFDASGSSTPDGARIVSYSWDFGNGKQPPLPQPQTTPQTETTFDDPRTYTVRLTITDEFGRTATTTRSVTIATP